MKVSVLVPVFNVEAYLHECIESVLIQSHKDFEIVLVNDGSTDGSAAVCNEYFAKYPDRIIAVHTENRGPLHARFKAMEKATGEVFVFLDADDCLRGDALEQIVRCFEEQPCDMVLFNSGECERFSTRRIRCSLDSGAAFDEESRAELYKSVILGRIPNSLCLKAVKAECADVPEHFLSFDAKYGEDLLMSVHLITNCRKIAYLNEGLYFYRDRQGSAVSLFNPNRKESVKTVHREFEKYIDLWGFKELVPLHNARKVRGWVDILLMLLKNRASMTQAEFHGQLKSMAEDSYFKSAYKSMDKTALSRKYRILSICLAKKQYFVLKMLSAAFSRK